MTRQEALAGAYECTCHRDCCECAEGPESGFLDHDADCHGCSRSGRWHQHEDEPCRVHFADAERREQEARNA